MKRRSLLIGMALTLSLTFQAQETPAGFSLKECMEYAISHNTRILKADLESAKLEHKVKELKSEGLPQIGLGAHVQFYPEIPTNILTGSFAGSPEESLPVQFGTDLNLRAGVEIKQLLYRKGFSKAQGAIDKLGEVNQLLAVKTKEDLVFELSKLYYQALIVHRKADLLVANLDQIEGMLVLLRKQFDNGFIQKIQVDQLRVNKLNLENRLTNINLQRNQILQALKYYMAMPLEQEITLTDSITEKDLSIEEALALSPDFQNKPELALLEAQEVLSSFEIENYRADFAPSIFLTGAYNLQGFGNNFADFGKGNSWFHYGFIGIQLEQPIFDGNKKKSQIAQSQIAIQQLQYEQQFVDQSLRLQYHNAQQKLQVNFNNLQTLKENRAVAETVFEVAKNRYAQGIGKITELLTSETAMREAQANYLTALLEARLAYLELLYSKGELMSSLQ